MKPNPWKIAIIIAVVIVTVFATRKYDQWTAPEPQPDSTLVGSDSTQIVTTIQDTTEVEIGNTDDSGVPDSLCRWTHFRAATATYSVSGRAFGIHLQRVQITEVVTRSTIKGELWRLADGQNRITLRVGEGVQISKRDFTWNSEEKHWYDWIKPQVSLFSLVSRESGIVGLDLGWDDSKFGLMIGTNGEKPINHVGVRWRIYP